MANQNNVVKGKVGNLIFYERNGQKCIRTSPASVKQTAATKKRSLNFAVASAASSLMAANFRDLFTWKDGTRYNRITGAFSLWLKRETISDIPSGNIESLEKFQVNPGKMQGNKWKEHIHVTSDNNSLQITVDSFAPPAIMTIPKGTSIIIVTISSLIMQLPGRNYSKSVSSSISIKVRESFNGIKFNHLLEHKPSSVVITGFSIKCVDENLWDVKVRKNFTLPAGIVYAEWLGV